MFLFFYSTEGGILAPPFIVFFLCLLIKISFFYQNIIKTCRRMGILLFTTHLYVVCITLIKCIWLLPEVLVSVVARINILNCSFTWIGVRKRTLEKLVNGVVLQSQERLLPNYNICWPVNSSILFIGAEVQNIENKCFPKYWKQVFQWTIILWNFVAINIFALTGLFLSLLQVIWLSLLVLT